jgi:hypothetical protein
MRVIQAVLLQLASVLGSVPLCEDILGTFLSVECIDFPEEERTSLPPIIGRLSHRDLLQWYLLDEDTFVHLARKVIIETHEDAMLIAPTALDRNIKPLRDQGMNEEEILDFLSRRYYKALRKIRELQRLAAARK